MSLVAATSLHTITVLEPNKVQGSAFGTSYNYAPATPPVQYKCRVVPVRGMERAMLLQRGMANPHRIHLNVEPRAINETKRVRWEGPLALPGTLAIGNGTILRIMSLPLLASGMARKWKFEADARTEDNQALYME